MGASRQNREGAVKTCPNGHAVSKAAAFCTTCGTPVALRVDLDTSPTGAVRVSTEAASEEGSWFRRKRGLVFALVAVPLAVVAGAAAAAVLIDARDKGGADEIFMEPVASAGQDPFTDSVTVAPTSEAPADGAAAVEGSVHGSEPGLYGGSLQTSVCDRRQLAEFLGANAAKGRAFADVLDISVDAIPDYVASLTPVILRGDTRVTNHGFVNGHASEFQAVLESGTAVLVDRTGVPRVKCSCGNPLTPPDEVQSPTFGGDEWPGFDPSRLQVVFADVDVDVFVLTDPSTGDTFGRPAGTDGDQDRPAAPAADQGEPSDGATHEAVDLLLTAADVGLADPDWAQEVLEFEDTDLGQCSDDQAAGLDPLVESSASAYVTSNDNIDEEITVFTSELAALSAFEVAIRCQSYPSGGDLAVADGEATTFLDPSDDEIEHIVGRVGTVVWEVGFYGAPGCQDATSLCTQEPYDDNQLAAAASQRAAGGAEASERAGDAGSATPTTDAEQFMRGFLDAYVAGDVAALGDYATDEVLASFRQVPRGFEQYDLSWSDDQCGLDSSGAGGCLFTLSDGAGSGAAFTVTYHETDRSGHLIIDNVTFEGD